VVEHDNALTDSGGYYFFSPPAIGSGIDYYTLIYTNTTDTGRLSIMFRSPLYYTATVPIQGLTFDVANPTQLDPADDAMVDLPYLFQWEAPSWHTGYQLIVYTADFVSTYSSPTNVHMSNYNLQSLPSGFGPGTPSKWTVRTYPLNLYLGTTAFGGAFEARDITFTDLSAQAAGLRGLGWLRR
jgi:hypothetical protein